MRTFKDQRTLLQTTILVLLLAPALLANAHYAQAQTDGTGTTEDPAGTLTGQSSVLVLELGSQDAAETEGYLSLPSNATVVSASVTVIPGLGAASPAAKGDEGAVHPDGPWVDVGADGTIDWMFDGIGYGEAGHQTKFGNGVSEVSFGLGSQFDHPWTSAQHVAGDHISDISGTIMLPRTTQIASARLLLEPELRNDWWNTSWQRRVPIEVTAQGEDLMPLRVERDVPLGAFFRDPNPELRLVLVDNGTERPWPFCVISSSFASVTLGFDVPMTTAGETNQFYLYYDNPFGPESAYQRYEPSPVDIMFSTDTKPPLKRPKTGESALLHPYGIFQTSNGTVLVADTANHRVVMLSPTGKLLRSFGVKGQPGCDASHLAYPYDVTQDLSGRTIIADTWCQRVLVLGSDWAIERTIGVPGVQGSDASHFNFPWAVASDEEEQIIVTDNRNDRVQGFQGIGFSSASWTFGHTSQPGQDSSHLDSPMGIASKEGYYIVDAFNSRVQFFSDPSIPWATRTFGTNRLTTPSDVAVGKDRVYITDSDEGKVLVLDKTGFFKNEIKGLTYPLGIALGPTNEVWISDSGANRLLRLVNADLTIGGPEMLGPPSDLEILIDGWSVANISGPLITPVTIDGLGTAIEDIISHSKCTKDRYENEICALDLQVEGPSPGTGSGLRINGLDIQYTSSLRMSVALAPGTVIDKEGAKLLPVMASSRNGGRVTLMGFEPELDRPPFPLLPSIVFSVEEGSARSYVMDLDASFQNEGPLKFQIEVVSGPDGASAWVDEDNGLWVGMPTGTNSTQDLNLTIHAFDIFGQAAQMDLTVSIVDVPDMPIILTRAIPSAHCGIFWNTSIEAADGDSDRLVFYLLSGPDGMTMETDGRLEWTPRSGQDGLQTISVQVSDGTFDTENIFPLEVTCTRQSQTIHVQTNATVLAGNSLRIPVETEDPAGIMPSISVLRGPQGLRYDTSLGSIVWSPSLGQVGVHLVTLSIVDDDQDITRTIRVEVLRPRPWVRLTSGPDRENDHGLTFSGEAGSPIGKVKRTESRVDDGQWVPVTGARIWHIEVLTDNLMPGRHRIEFRAFDGDYSEVVSQSFLVFREAERTQGPDRSVEQWLVITILIISMIIAGGIVVIKHIDGYVFCVQRAPDGPSLCVPLGQGTENAGGTTVVESDAEDFPDQPPRNVRCFVCLGHIKSAEEFLECPRCGRVYHTACAKRIKACPMDGTDLINEEN